MAPYTPQPRALPKGFALKTAGLGSLAPYAFSPKLELCKPKQSYPFHDKLMRRNPLLGDPVVASPIRFGQVRSQSLPSRLRRNPITVGDQVTPRGKNCKFPEHRHQQHRPPPRLKKCAPKCPDNNAAGTLSQTRANYFAHVGFKKGVIKQDDGDQVAGVSSAQRNYQWNNFSKIGAPCHKGGPKSDASVSNRNLLTGKGLPHVPLLSRLHDSIQTSENPLFLRDNRKPVTQRPPLRDPVTGSGIGEALSDLPSIRRKEFVPGSKHRTSKDRLFSANFAESRRQPKVTGYINMDATTDEAKHVLFGKGGKAVPGIEAEETNNYRIKYDHDLNKAHRQHRSRQMQILRAISELAPVA